MANTPIRLARIAARLATGSTYVVLGSDAARTPGARVGLAAPTLATIRKVVPIPISDELIVRGNGAVQAVAGAVLAAGVAQRPAAALLAASLIPTTVAGHAYWTADDPTARKMQQVQFSKNVAMLGGLLFAITDSDR